MLALVWQFDPRGSKVGGIGNYVHSFIQYAPKHLTVGVVGVTTNKEEVGKWQELKLGNRNVKFLPVCFVRDENKKNFIPLSIKFCFGLVRYKSLLKECKILFHQRMEYIFASFDRDIKQYCLIHFDLTHYLDRENGESYWRKFPSLFRTVISIGLKKLDYIFSVNSNSISYIERHFETTASKLLFTPTWADGSIFNYVQSIEAEKNREIRSQFGLKPDSKIILIVGRLNEQKNVELAIEVVREFKDVEMVIVGDGPLRESLAQIANTMGVQDKVKFIGRLAPSKISELYYATSLYLSTSKTEGMSVALLESLYMGVPVISTPTGESNLIVSQGVNGFVSKGWDVEELRSYIDTILYSSSEFCRTEIIATVSDIKAEKTIPKILSKMEYL